MAEYIEHEHSCKKCIHNDACRNIITKAFTTLTDEQIEQAGNSQNACDFFKCAADVVEVRHGEKLLPITEAELRHLINDTIAYIWRLEDRGCASAKYGYFTRKELYEKLKRFEKENFPRFEECTNG